MTPGGCATHFSAEDAIRFAISEYLHVDCRLMHARQWGRVRSHCVHAQQLLPSAVVLHSTCTSFNVATFPSLVPCATSIRITHFCLAFYALLAAQCWLVALLFLPEWLVVTLHGTVRTGGRMGIVHNATTCGPLIGASGMQCDTDLVLWLYAPALCEVTGGNKGRCIPRAPESEAGMR